MLTNAERFFLAETFDTGDWDQMVAAIERVLIGRLETTDALDS